MVTIDFGADIKLTDDFKDIELGNDFTIVDGEDNLNQSVVNSIASVKTSLQSHKQIGIDFTDIFGNPDFEIAKGMLSREIRIAMNLNPRIESVDNLEITGEQIDGHNTFVVNMNYTANNTNYVFINTLN